MTQGRSTMTLRSQGVARGCRSSILCGLIGVLAFAPCAFADDWPQFLGPSRNGISAETGLLKEWSPQSPNELWRSGGGVGMSAVVVQQKLAVTLVQRDGRQWLLALDAQTGRGVHRVDLAPEYKNSMGNGPRATPALAGTMAYAFTGEGILAAIDLTTGQVKWRRNVVAELGAEPAEYGMACSPLVDDGRVIVTAGAPRGTVAAYDAVTGEPVWQAIAANGADTAGYSSPALLEVGGKKQLVAFEGKAALGIAPDTGRVLWRYPYATDFDCNIVTPIAHAGRVFLSAGENHGSVLLDVKSSGEQFRVTAVWESLGARSVMRNEWQTSILHEGHLYGFDNVGNAGPVSHLNCVDIATGKLKWQQLRFGKGNLICADGKLFITTVKGELVVVEASPEGYTELGRKAVLQTTRQAPSLAQGRLYLRDDEEIVCLDVRQSPGR